VKIIRVLMTEAQKREWERRAKRIQRSMSKTILLSAEDGWIWRQSETMHIRAILDAKKEKK